MNKVIAKLLLGSLLLSFTGPLSTARPTVPEDLLDDFDFRDETGLNEFTVPAIARVFDELEKIAPLAYDSEHLKAHERLPLDRTKLSMRLGTLIADGFIAVQTGHSDDVPVIASHLSRYAKALGAGDEIKKHSASLLEHAKAQDLDLLKKALGSTQRDVERELASLRDADLAHLISLGGWLQALGSASQAVEKKFTPERALTLFREDVADYYAESLGALDESVSDLPHLRKMRTLLHGLRTAMALEDNQEPTHEQVKEVAKVATELVEIARQ